MLNDALISLRTSVWPQLGFRHTEHISPSLSGLKGRCFVKPFSRVSAAWREVIGIDFGTTNCRVAVMEKNGNPKMIEIDGKICMPSVVSFDQKGNKIVGAHPKDAISYKTISGIKRLIGRSYGKEGMELLKKMIPHEMILPPHGERQDEECIISTNRTQYSPTNIASLIIGKLIQETERCRGRASRARVSVPPFFDCIRIDAVMRASNQRGWPSVEVVDEAEAAAVYYMKKDPYIKGGCFAVIDLGGGSFDISIVQGSRDEVGPICENIATEHVEIVAGIGFDHAMMELRGLSRSCLDKAAKEQGKTIKVDDVILVGGMSKVPGVRELVEGIFGKGPSKEVNSDEAVACGAAIMANRDLN